MIPPDEANARADEILSRAEFQPPEPSPLEEVVTWIRDRIASLFEGLSGGGSGSSLSSIVSWIVLGALVAGLAFLISRVVRTMQTEPAEESQIDIATTRPPDHWLVEADRLETNGRWKEGLRCRYRGLVAELIERGFLRDVPGRTTGEYRAELAANLGEASPEFAGASELFDRAWYGDLPTGAPESERFQELASSALRAARSARRRVEAAP